MIKFFKIQLTLLLGCFVLFSCEDPKAIRFDIDPAGGAQAYYTDSLSLLMSSIQIDSNITSQDYRFQKTDLSVLLMVGHAQDPYFGDEIANANFTPTLSPSVTGTTLDFTIDNTYTVDSIKLRFSNSRVYWGDTLKTLKVGVYRLSDLMVPYKNYDKSEKITYDQTPLTSFDMNFEGFFGKNHDTTKLLEVKLPTDAFDDLINLPAGDSKRSDVDDFGNFFKGFSLRPLNNPNLIFGLNSNLSSVVVYAHKGESSTFYIFPLTGQRYSNLELDRSGTAISSLGSNSGEIPSANTGNLGLVQSGSGVYTKVNIPNITGLNSSIISSAILEFEVDSTYDNPMFRSTFFYAIAPITADNKREKNEKGQLLFVPSGVSTTLNIVGELVVKDTTDNKVRFDISNLIQKGINENSKSLNCAIFPASQITNSNGNRVAITNGSNLDRSFLKNPVIKLYYVKK